MLNLKQVTLRRGARVLFTGVNLVIQGGWKLGLTGANGCGKSSLLAHLCGTLPSVFQTSGKIILHDRTLDNLPPHERKLGILFQDDLLFRHLSVGENLAFALSSKITRNVRRENIEQALYEIVLSGMSERDPASLSG